MTVKCGAAVFPSASTPCAITKKDFPAPNCSILSERTRLRNCISGAKPENWRDSRNFSSFPDRAKRTANDLAPPFRGKALAGFPFGVSSTEIRRRIKAGLSIEHLVPGTVAEAIKNNGLYL